MNKTKQAAFDIAFTGNKNAETKYIRAQLKELSPSLDVVFIPQTLWELFLLAELYEKGFNYSLENERQVFTRRLFTMIKVNLKSINFSNDEENTKLLLQILQRFTKTSKAKNSPVERELRDSLIAEIEVIKKKSQFY